MSNLFPSFPTLEESREIARGIVQQKYFHQQKYSHGTELKNHIGRGFDTFWNAAVASKGHVRSVVGDDLRLMAGIPFPTDVKEMKNNIIDNIIRGVRRVIPVTHFDELNPRIDLDKYLCIPSLLEGRVTERSPLLDFDKNHVGTKINGAVEVLVNHVVTKHFPSFPPSYLKELFHSVEDLIPNEKRCLVLSFNPLDVLLASTHAIYSSCHSLTGEYCTGPVHYALFPYVGIMFLTKNSQKISTWAPETKYPFKMARLMVFLYPEAAYLGNPYCRDESLKGDIRLHAGNFLREVARRWLPPGSKPMNTESVHQEIWCDVVDYLKGYRECALVVQSVPQSSYDVSGEKYPSPPTICPNCGVIGGIYSSSSYFCESCAWAGSAKKTCSSCSAHFPQRDALCRHDGSVFCPRCSPYEPTRSHGVSTVGTGVQYQTA